MAGSTTPSDPPPATPLARLVDDYLLACRARGLSLSTIETSYGYPLRAIFLRWATERGIGDVAELNSRQVNAFAAALADWPTRSGKPLARASVHAYMRSVRLFLGWAAQEGEVVRAKPPLPRLERRLLDVLTADELDRLVAAASSDRDRLILGVLSECGVRAGELCSLAPADVIEAERRRSYLRVRGKGGRDRMVPLPPRLHRQIERYLRHRPTDAPPDRLFVGSRRGLSGEYEPLTPNGVLRLVRRTAARAGIAKHVYTHLLRHTWITHALRGGMNPLIVAQIAGHESLRMIERVYSHLTPGDAYDSFMKLYAEQ